AGVATLERADTALSREAQDLHLPLTHKELTRVDEALTQLAEKTVALVPAARDVRQAHGELQHQRQSEPDAGRDAERDVERATGRRLAADDATVRLDTLRDAVGVKVADLQQKLQAARTSVSEGETLLELNEGLQRGA